MSEAPQTSDRDTHLQAIIDQACKGDSHAKEKLLHHACDRLLRLTRRMFHQHPGLRRWEQTDDVFQNSMVRLHRAIHAVEVESVRHFLNLAAVQIRRELIDLARKHFGPEGIARNHHTDKQPSDESGGMLHSREEPPADLADWSAFHEQVSHLPETEREVVGLLYYEGLSQEAAAQVLGCSPRTVRRLWQEAKVRLYKGVNDGPAATGETE